MSWGKRKQEKVKERGEKDVTIICSSYSYNYGGRKYIVSLKDSKMTMN